MPDKFDPYREALVVEAKTIWDEAFDDLEHSEKIRLEQELHAHPEQAHNLSYVRMHTGFCRTITVTPEDIARMQG